MLWRLELATVWRLNQVAKITCLAETGAVFKSFSVFPRTFVTVHLFSKLSPFQTLRESIFKPHWCFISYPNHQEKVCVFAFSVSFSFSWIFLLQFGLILCSKYFSLYVMGMACLLWYCSHMFSCWAVTMCFSLFCYLPVVESENLFLNGFGVYLTCSFHLLEYWC